MPMKPAYVSNAIDDLGNLRLGEWSGWKPRSVAHVAELRDVFRAGQFGQSCDCCVKMIGKYHVDGTPLIHDGVSTVAAGQGHGQGALDARPVAA